MAIKETIKSILSQKTGVNQDDKKEKLSLATPDIPSLDDISLLGEISGLKETTENLSAIKSVKDTINSISEVSKQTKDISNSTTEMLANIPGSTDSYVSSLSRGVGDVSTSVISGSAKGVTGGIPPNIGDLSEEIRKSASEIPKKLTEQLKGFSGKADGTLEQLSSINDIASTSLGGLVEKSGLEDIIRGLKDFSGSFGLSNQGTSGLRGSGEQASENQSLNQKPYYTVIFTVDDLDLSTKVDNIKIVSSIESVYTAVVIQFQIDSQDLVLEKIYGQQPITLTISLRTEDETETAIAEWNLIAIDTKTDLDMKPQNGENAHQLSNNVTLVCVIQEPFMIMNTLVNRLIDETKQLTPLDAVNDMIKSCVKNVGNFDVPSESEIDNKNSNQEPIYQIIIPPMTLTKAIRYLDHNFGIYNGPYYIFCTVEQGTLRFRMADLSKMIEEPEEYTLYLLTTGGDQKESVFDKVSPTEDKYYVYDPVMSKYKGNKSVMNEAYKHRFITRPMDKLYHTIDVDMEDIFKNNTVKSGGTDMFLHDSVKNTRYKIHSEHTGYETSETFLRSKMSQKLSDLSYMNFSIDRNIDITAPMRIGIPIKVETDTPAFLEFAGKYIVSRSIVILTRSDHELYDCHVKNRCFRGDILA